eukprot:1164804-Alexandrium_andersonii.AAC.1
MLGCRKPLVMSASSEGSMSNRCEHDVGVLEGADDLIALPIDSSALVGGEPLHLARAVGADDARELRVHEGR